MQHQSNPTHPQSIGGIHKKGIGIGEDALIRITAGLCANPESWQQSPQQIVNKAQTIVDELFRYKSAEE